MSKKTYKCLLCQETYDKVGNHSKHNMTKISVIPPKPYMSLVQHIGHLPNNVQCCSVCKTSKHHKSLWQCVIGGVFSEIIFLKIFFKTYKTSLQKLSPAQLELLLNYVFYEYTPSNELLKYQIYSIIKNSIATGNFKPWVTLNRTK